MVTCAGCGLVSRVGPIWRSTASDSAIQKAVGASVSPASPGSGHSPPHLSRNGLFLRSPLWILSSTLINIPLSSSQVGSPQGFIHSPFPSGFSPLSTWCSPMTSTLISMLMTITSSDLWFEFQTLGFYCTEIFQRLLINFSYVHIVTVNFMSIELGQNTQILG